MADARTDPRGEGIGSCSIDCLEARFVAGEFIIECGEVRTENLADAGDGGS